ncbi:proteasome assembly chaperone family protein [Candidatus Woesearchaeota archaeon]|nr:proteasome assembly chaperone family protein [Candidatus Woesearchaeota archaeon]
MKVELNKKPKNVTILCGFPGVGLIGTIATRFLIEHLKFEEIGYIHSDKLKPIMAIHQSKMIEPIEIYYNQKKKLVIIQGIISLAGIEWLVADAIKEVAKTLNAKEIIILEGITAKSDKTEVLCYGDAFKKSNLKKLDEGIVLGTTAALLLKLNNVSCIFSETKTGLPDSAAAASLILSLDKQIGLNVDVKPLMQTAREVESKIKTIMEQSKKSLEQKEKKDDLSYLG